MNNFVKKIQIFGLLSPKYYSIVRSKIELKLAIMRKETNQVKLKKANEKYCHSFYKFFKKHINESYFKTDNVKHLKNVVFVYRDGGLETMPKIARFCFERLKAVTSFEVILIDKSNIQEYSCIDPEILSMYRNGEISLTMFSDILRFNLLAIHDCIWIDSTVFLREDFPSGILNYDFISPYCEKGKSLFDNKPELYKYPDLSVSQNYFLAGKKKEIFIKRYDLTVAYLKSETTFLKLARPYYLTYFVFEFLNDEDLVFQKNLENRMPSNENAECIEGLKDEIYDSSKYGYIFSNNTFLFKLSYKMNFKAVKNNKLTVFGKFLETYNISENDVI